MPEIFFIFLLMTAEKPRADRFLATENVTFYGDPELYMHARRVNEELAGITNPDEHDEKLRERYGVAG